MTETQPKGCFDGSVESVSTFLLRNVKKERRMIIDALLLLAALFLALAGHVLTNLDVLGGLFRNLSRLWVYVYDF